jgi:release factor glutamine methyltransferase
VWTIEAVLRWATDDFRARGIETPRLDAEVLLAHALGTTRIGLIVDAKRELDAGELGPLRALVTRRRAREPMAYIVGAREFYGRSFRVDRRTLVPRPDTETLVDVALERTRAVSMSMRALDLCTGSGCVAITLARERPTAFVVATDASEDALAVARDNSLRLGASNVALRSGDLFAALEHARGSAGQPGAGRRERPGSGVKCRFDVVTANPPYIPSGEIAGLMADVRDFEPRLALDGGGDGLAIVRRIVTDAPAHLDRGGVLAIEVGAGEAPDVARLFEQAGFANVDVRRDCARIERVVSGVLEEPRAHGH